MPGDVGPNPDAFFAIDPPPVMCLEDGSMVSAAEPPGGTPECPSDKNREGCPCDAVGETAACWPGLRVDRNRGACRDGTTRCEPYDEFRGRWGPCEGYVLPVEGATRGAAACNCFSAGQWQLDNLVICGWNFGDGVRHGYSSYLDAAGMWHCPLQGAPPVRPPGHPFSTNRLNVDCAGRFELCYTIKVGRADAPTPADCVVGRSCTEAWYPEAGVTQELPPLPAWASPDPACSTRFWSEGFAYGEMSVRGRSIECDPIDDGAGGEYVFVRVPYCPPICGTNPSHPACMLCGNGASGGF